MNDDVLSPECLYGGLNPPLVGEGRVALLFAGGLKPAAGTRNPAEAGGGQPHRRMVERG